MKVLKNCIRLSCSVKIYVPSTVEVDKPSDTTHYINKTLAFLSNEFGGATATEALGAWTSNEGKLIKEKIILVFAFATGEQLSQSIERVYDFCLSLKHDLTQSSIALEVNNELYLI